MVGAGAAGLAVVEYAGQAGIRPLLVTDGPPGGDCTFTGCVPSKTLLAAAAAGQDFLHATHRVRTTVDAIAATETVEVLREQGAEVIEGRARFVGPREIEVDGVRHRGARVVVATGARPSLPPIPGIDDVEPLTSDTVFDLTVQPERLLVLGGGPIGCELAQAFQRLGTQVALVEALPRLLSGEEPEASQAVLEALTEDGVELVVGEPAIRVEEREGAVALVTERREIVGDRLLVATGRTPTTDLDLDAAGIELDERGYVATDDRLRTTAEDIFAVGDVTGRSPYTHAGYFMGYLVAKNLTKKRGGITFDASVIPHVTFTAPEVARVGMSEAEAVAHGGRVAYLPMAEIDRAVIEGAPEGFVKLVAGPRRLLRNAGGGRILGATIVAARAGEMIHEPTLAMRTAMFAGRLAQTTHAYPTWSMAVQKAAAQFFNEVDGRRARRAES